MVYTRAASLLVFIALALVPALFGMFTAYQLGLYLIYGLVGQGIALCWGRAGFPAARPGAVFRHGRIYRRWRC